MAKTVKAQLKCRHDTAANWTAKNPVLLDGELGVETDTTFLKIGDGATAWTSLKYVTSKSAVYDNSGNVIADTYAKKTDVTVKGVKVDGATSPLVPDSSGVVTIPNADLSNYYTKTQVNTAVSTAKTEIEGKIPKVDARLSTTSENPVQNKVIKNELDTYAKKTDVPAVTVSGNTISFGSVTIGVD